ncbi:MAG: peptidase, partial [Candidatus Dadabacteria bacterium]
APPTQEAPADEPRDMEEAVLEPETEPKSEEKEAAVPPPPGTDPGHPAPEGEGEEPKKS